MIVIYAEKPDMAEKIASALGEKSYHSSEKKQGFYNIKIRGLDYSVTWGYGHLCTLANAKEYDEAYRNWSRMPLPFIPDDFKIVLNERDGIPVGKTYSVVKKLFCQADYIINATDFDREGELIFYYLYKYMGCKKPVMRMKVSSTTTSGLREAFYSLLDNDDVIPIRQSAECRSIADWVVGCNMTAAMTVKSGSSSVISIGRVQTPTLSIVTGRDQEIRDFKPKDYYTVDAVFTTKDGSKYKGTCDKKKFDTKEEAESVLISCGSFPGTVTKTEETEKIQKVPNLYSLDSLQMEANGRYGFSVKRTLDVTQSLYDKGFVTYPRTDCQYLPEDMFGRIRQTQDMLKQHGYEKYFTSHADPQNMSEHRKRFFDDSKLGSHFAIIPTDQPAIALSIDEQKIYGLVAASVIRMLYPDAVLKNKKIFTEVNKVMFVSSGMSVRDPGWMEVDHKVSQDLLPDVKEGDQVDSNVHMSKKQTEPPAHFTEKTLLAAMITAGKNLEEEDLKKFMSENKIDGLGTVATRASIIENLIRRGVIERKGKEILATQKGFDLIDIIPVKEIKSAALTAAYERKLNLIVHGKQDPDEFLEEIYRSTTDWCGQIKKLSDKEAKTVADGKDEKDGSSIMCPICGRPVAKYAWGYGCTGYKDGCKFSISQTIAGKKLTDRQMTSLCEKGTIGPLSGFVSKKTGKKFEASLKVEYTSDSTGKKEFTKIGFVFQDRKEDPDLVRARDNASEPDAVCPECGAKMIKGTYGWECKNHCGVTIPYIKSKHRLTRQNVEDLLTDGETAEISDFVSQKGKYFTSNLRLQNKKVIFSFQTEQ